MNTRGAQACVVLGTMVAWCVCAQPARAEASAPVTAFAQVVDQYGYGLPPDVSVDGHRIDNLIHLVHWFMIALFVGWGTFLVYCLIRFRQRSGHQASAAPIRGTISKYVEGGVVVVEAVLLLGFSIPIWGSIKNDLPLPDDDPLRVRVLAEQFNWNFHYAGADGIFGRRGPQYIEQALNPVGLDPEDPNGVDDIVSGVFNLPVDRPVICELTSKDVIHSLSIPPHHDDGSRLPMMRDFSAT